MPAEVGPHSMEYLSDQVRAFAEERDWTQFHSVRNLILALVGEVGELAAEIQWIGDDGVSVALRDPAKRETVSAELADVFNYLLRIADVLEVDLGSALLEKLEVNEKRYPRDKARGSSAKYTDYE